MGERERQLIDARDRRDLARDRLDRRLARVRGAVEQRSLPARMADEALFKVRGATEQVGAVLGEYRWAAGLTALGLTGWFLRRPLVRWGRAALDHVRKGEPQLPAQRLREWISRKVKP
jgi:hypothetical protein